MLALSARTPSTKQVSWSGDSPDELKQAPFLFRTRKVRDPATIAKATNLRLADFLGKIEAFEQAALAPVAAEEPTFAPRQSQSLNWSDPAVSPGRLRPVLARSPKVGLG
jgi:hypothetical protein